MDQAQSALASDWTWQTVDLSAYRGRVISLRFVLTTIDPLPEGAVTAGFGLDDLLIQDVPPVPTDVPTLEPTVIPTQVPTQEPTLVPTEILTEVRTLEPTLEPTHVPTEVPPERQTGA